MTPSFRPFKDNQQGNSLIEMAFVLPLLIVMLFGVVDISASYSRKMELEQAAQSGVEMVTAAGDSASAMSDAALASDVASVAGLASSAVTITRWRQCPTGPLTGTATVCSDGKVGALYWRIVVQESYRPPLGFNMLAKAGQPVILRGTAVVRGL